MRRSIPFRLEKGDKEEVKRNDGVKNTLINIHHRTLADFVISLE